MSKSTVARYTLEYRAPKHKKWHPLSVSAPSAFCDAEIHQHRQQIAERITALRGAAVVADQIAIRMLKDGEVCLFETCAECEHAIPVVPEGGIANRHHAEPCSLFAANQE